MSLDRPTRASIWLPVAITAASALLAGLATGRAVAQEAAPAMAMPTVVQAGEPVEPLGAYLVNDPARGVQFLDAAGRRLYFGAHAAGDQLVFAPAEAATASAALTPITAQQGSRLDVPASFWIEISKPDATRAGLALQRGGYAVSDYIPVTWILQATRVKGAEGAGYHAPSQLWYDRDHNLIETNNASRFSPEAVYYRIYQMFSEDGCQMSLVFNPGQARPPADDAQEHPGEIVLPAGADLRERLAATELARAVRLITGKRMPILCEPSPAGGAKIVLGRKLAAGLGDDLAFLEGSDGFAIRRRGDAAHVFGATSRGTLFGVFRLVELNSDIIWFRPDRRFGAVFTPRETMAFAAADLRTKPAFRYRTWSGPGGNDYCDTYLWQLRNGVGGNYTTRDGRFTPGNYRQKELGRYASVGGNWKELPLAQAPGREDFHAIIDGKRVVTGGGQPCFTHPDLMPATLAEARKRLAEGPEELDFFSYNYSDSWACCECERCMAPIPLPGGGALAAKSIVPQNDPWFRSTRTFLEASRLAAGLNETRPGLDCFVLAYIYTAAWPAIKPHPKVLVRFASYDTSSMRFPLREQTAPAYYAPESWATRYAQWIEGHPEGMGAYEYFFTSIPAMFAEAAATNMQDLARAGAPTFHSQTQPDTGNKSIESFGLNATMWDMNAMDQWLISRLMWDPFESVDMWRADFIARVYREAAPEMAEYYRLFGREWFNRSNKTFVNCHSPAGRVYDDFIVKPGLEKTLRDLLAAAAHKAGHASARRHLRQMLEAYDQMGASLGRLAVPRVAEIAAEWEDPGSPHWNRAFVAESFRDALNFDYAANLATNRTEVRLAHDRAQLYFRVTARGAAAVPSTAGERYPMGDRVEFCFNTGNRTRTLCVVGADGAASDLRDWDHRYDSGWQVRVVPLKNGWSAVGRIPLDAIKAADATHFEAVIVRVAVGGEESYFRADTNRTRAHPVGSNHTFSRYELSEGGH